MDSKSIAPEPLVEAGKPSRLPAGSTLVVNGIHVPHPHAEVNLPGAGDPRLGTTDAVTEFVEHIAGEDGAVRAELKQVPLSDNVKPRRLTTDPKAKEVAPLAGAGFADGAASGADLQLKTDPENKMVEEKE